MSRILSILLRVLLLAACAAGSFRSVFRKRDESEAAGGIWFYTVQSNLWVMLFTAVYLTLSVVSLFNGVFPAVRALEIARFAVAVGITVTLLVFWIVLTPQVDRAYLKSLNNLLVHTLVPVLFLLDFFVFDRIAPLSASEALWCAAMPLYYTALTFLHAAMNPKLTFSDGSRYPYFFLDADKIGWFRVSKCPGVFWWMLLTIGLTLGLGYFYRFLLSAL